MNLIIHRGTKEIGGSCVELLTAKTRILIDFGMPLVDEGRRLTLMVDVFYDNRVKLILSAEAQPEHLLKVEEAAQDARIRAMVFEFERTASRLVEMQSRDYLAQQRMAA